MTEATEVDRDARLMDERAWQLIERCGYAAAALAVLPIPYSETVGVTAVHVSMVIGVGKIYGVELGRESAVKFVTRLGATVGLSYLGTRLAIGTAKLVLPVLPGLVGAPLVFGSTLGLGAVARAHFSSPGEELSDDEVKALYRSAVDRARANFDPRRVRSRDARDDAEVLARDEAPEPSAPPSVAPVKTAGPAAATTAGPAVVKTAGPPVVKTAGPVADEPPAGAPTPTTERARERLERLRKLHEQGFLGPDEFDAASKKVLEE